LVLPFSRRPIEMTVGCLMSAHEAAVLIRAGPFDFWMNDGPVDNFDTKIIRVIDET
jgi:hypothetical protein